MERRDLEESDCRVYQMLPSSSPARRRKRRRPGGFYLMDGVGGEIGTQALDRDMWSKVELPSNSLSGALTAGQTPSFSTAAIITPTTAGMHTDMHAGIGPFHD